MINLAAMLAGAKADFPTGLGTAGLRKLGHDFLRQSLFSARLTNATAVQALRDAVQDVVTGTDNIAEARVKLKAIGAALGYDPATGFPGDDDIPAAEEGGLQDLYSTDRINLQLKTQEDLAQGAAKNVWGMEPGQLEEYPAWELVRFESRDVERGFVRRKGGLISVPEEAWDSPNGRWHHACVAAGDAVAMKVFAETGRMVARKDSGVWAALGAGAGGYDDTLGNDFEPFAFNSGMGREEIDWEEWESLGGSTEDLRARATDLGDEVDLREGRFDADVLETLKDGLESGDLKFRVKVSVSQ